MEINRDLQPYTLYHVLVNIMNLKGLSLLKYSMFHRNFRLDQELVECEIKTHNFGRYPQPEAILEPQKVCIELEEQIPVEFLEGEQIKSLKFTNYYFILSKRFSREYFKWKSGDFKTAPLINQSEYFKFGTTILKNNAFKNREEYTFVNEKVWKILIKYFGGGPEIKINYPGEKYSLYDTKYIHVAVFSQKRSFKGFVFSKDTTLEKALGEISQAFGFMPKDCILYDFFKEKFYRKFEETDLKTRLCKLQILHGNLMVLENANARGEFGAILATRFSSSVLEKTNKLLRTNIFETILLSKEMSRKTLKWLRTIMSSLGTKYLSLVQNKDLMFLYDDTYTFTSLTITAQKMNNSVVDSKAILFLINNLIKRNRIFRSLSVYIRTTAFHGSCVVKQLFAILERVKCVERDIFLTGREVELKYYRDTLQTEDVLVNETSELSDLKLYT